MATISLKTTDQNEYEISISCIADFNKLSQQRQIKILKQLGVNARSFVQYVSNEKRTVFSDIKLLVDDSRKESQMSESNVRQIERKYGEIIRELYTEKVSVKTIAVNIAKFEQSEILDSGLKVSESIVRNVVRNMDIQRADDRKKGKHKSNKKAGKRLVKKKSDTGQIEKQITKNAMLNDEQIQKADSQRQIQEQITKIERTDVQQIDSLNP